MRLAVTLALLVMTLELLPSPNGPTRVTTFSVGGSVSTSMVSVASAVVVLPTSSRNSARTSLVPSPEVMGKEEMVVGEVAKATKAVGAADSATAHSVALVAVPVRLMRFEAGMLALKLFRLKY